MFSCKLMHMDAINQNPKPLGPMTTEEFNARLATLSAKYGPNVALKMARRERKARSPQHKAAMIRRAGLADVAITMTGQFHSL